MFAALSAPKSARADGAEEDRAGRHHEQAVAYYRVGGYEEAIDEWKRSYELDPVPSRLFNIGRAYEELGDKNEAVTFYQRYVESNPSGEAAAEANARILALRQALEEEPAARDARALLKEARKLMSRREYDRAVTAYQEAFELSRDPEVIYELGQAYRLGGDHEPAIDAYERYLTLAPGGERAADALDHQQRLEAELDAAETPQDDAETPQDDAGRNTATNASGADAAGGQAPEAPGEPLTHPPIDSQSGGGWSGFRIAGTTSLSIGTAGLGIGVYYGLKLRTVERTIEREEPEGEEFQDLLADGETAERNMFIAGAVGGTALVLGGVFLYLDARAGSGSSTSISLAPTMTDSAAAMSVIGRY